MTETTGLPALARAPSRAGRGRAGGRHRAGYIFVSVYVALLLLFGVVPTVYALYLAFTKESKPWHWAGLSNFLKTGHDFRFVPAFEHIALYLAIWLSALVILVLFLALMLHGGVRRVVPTFRFLFYLPGALAGSAAVVVWAFMFDPELSP